MKPIRLAAVCFGLVIGVALSVFALLRLFSNGEQLAFVSNRQGGHEIYVMNATGVLRSIGGSGARQLSGNKTWEDVFKQVAPLLEPLLNRPLVAIESGERSANNAPVWSPDGQRIAYTAYHAELRSQIHIINPNGVEQAS